MSNGDKKQKEELLRLVQEVIQKDKETRDQLHIGDKFRFIRERLLEIEAELKQAVADIEMEVAKKKTQILEDEVPVYVYIYNAQGIAFQTWQKMVSPSVFYEYSVNRPVYSEEAQVVSFIRSRPNKPQHGYIAFAIKKNEIQVLASDEKPPQDIIGTPLIKVREGSLRADKLLFFKHQDQIYVLNQLGQLTKKEDDEVS